MINYLFAIPSHQIQSILPIKPSLKNRNFEFIQYNKSSQQLMKFNNKKNLSFISNQQLIEGLRNRSSKSLIRNRSVETSISLIEQKKYERDNSMNKSKQINVIQNQNTNPNSNMNTFRLSKDSVTANIMKFLKENISNKMILHQAQLLINQIPNNSQNYGISKQQAALMAKIEQLYIEKTKMKKEKKQLEQKLKEQTLQMQNRQKSLRQQNQRLHRLVLKQSQMITNQASNQQDDAQQLRRILYSQAKTIEVLGKSKNSRSTFSSLINR